MRIETISLEGLWAYRDPQHIDISGLPLVIFEGENGVGKSAILIDAVVAALWGQFPSKTTEEAITTGSRSGTVTVEFTIKDVRYKVSRTYSRSTSATATLDVTDSDSPTGWKNLKKGSKEVTATVENLIGMSYTTSAMTWLAEQGEYGRFAKALPSERFRLLSSVFDLDRFADLGEAAKEKAKAATQKADQLDGRILEISDSNIEEDANAATTGVGALSTDQLAAEHAAAQLAVDTISSSIAAFTATDPNAAVVTKTQQRDAVRNGRLHLLESARADGTRANAAGVAARERRTLGQVQAEQRLAASRQNATNQLASFVSLAESNRVQATNALAEIASAEAALPGIIELSTNAQQRAAEAQTKRATLSEQSAALESSQASLRTEFTLIQGQSGEAAERIRVLAKMATDAENASCFTCGQHLTAAEAAALIAVQEAELARLNGRLNDINVEGSSSKTRLDELSNESAQLNAAIAAIAAEQATLAARLERANGVIATKADREAALANAGANLSGAEAENTRALEAADAEFNTTVAALVADEATAIAAATAALDAANAVAGANVEPSAEEVALEQAVAEATERAQAATAGYNDALAAMYANRTSQAATLDALTQEQVKRAAAAAARSAQEERLTKAMSDRTQAHKDLALANTLAKAYSPAGIPAMILNNVMDELNEAINAPLKMLSSGELSVNLSTTREKAKGGAQSQITVNVETPTGVRDYLNISGGQQFRVDLAIRLGLTQVLSRGTGTPIETFILDEGWGTLDKKGIKHTFETLTKHSDNSAVLTVSHIDDVQDVFGSRVQVDLSMGTSNAVVIR